MIFGREAFVDKTLILLYFVHAIERRRCEVLVLWDHVDALSQFLLLLYQLFLVSFIIQDRFVNDLLVVPESGLVLLFWRLVGIII